MFFDDFPRFFETSSVIPKRGRLNLRYEAIFGENSDIFQGARVLDLASHDGRWSFAALRTGAAHVTGIEARQEAVDNASANLAHYGADPDSYRFICGDIFDVLRREDFEVDVVLCLGYLYHTYRHTELLYRIRQIDPQHLLVDTQVVPVRDKPFVKLYVDRPHKPGEAALDPFSHGMTTLVGRPSIPALQMMLRAYDFEIEHTCDWHALMAKHPDAGIVHDYANGERVTLRCRSGASIPPTPSATTGSGVSGSTSTTITPPDASLIPTVAAPNEAEQPVARVTARKGWRDLVNRGLARATGYELRRAARSHHQATGSEPSQE
ncbi:class I SAM-dependent methyltransferase [Haloechinothrix salitolerans]|uniref:Class I SAM-dependent methyltransferase n=1 Tax=Haloechinothrix salitolerans TaxID=926830 RepID=A0ABW2C3X6_9PSEU